MNSSRLPIAFIFVCGFLGLQADAANRFFMALPGTEISVPDSGPTTVTMLQSDEITIEVWFEFDGIGGVSAYQWGLPWLASPTTGTGTVEYVDAPGTESTGDSMFVNEDDPSFPFVEKLGLGPLYSEIVGVRFEAIATGILGPCEPHEEAGLLYLGEFRIQSSAFSAGSYTMEFLNFADNTAASSDDCMTLLPVDEYQSLIIDVVECHGDSHCCADGNCNTCSAYYCDISDGGAPCQGQPDCACAVEPRIFGEAGGNGGACQANGSVNLHDANHVWNAFQDINACDQEDGNPENADVGGNGGFCAKSGTVNLHDANHVWGVFQGINPCSAMCSGGPSPVMDDWQPGYTDSADITLVAETRTARPGEVIAVDVLIDQALKDLQGFQLEAIATGGTRGQLELIDIAIESRRDYVFASTGIDQNAANLNRGVVGAILPSAGLEGIATRANGYLATFTYQVSPDALGTFVIDLNDWHDRGQFAQESFLTSSFFGMVEISSTTPAVIVATSNHADSVPGALNR